MFSDYPFKFTRRHRVLASVITVSLLAVGAVALLSPQGQYVWNGPSATEVALQTEQARSRDLSAQIDEMEAKLTAPRPQIGDKAQLARAEDLKKQIEELEAKLTQTQQELGRAEAEAAKSKDAANLVNGTLKATRERQDAATKVTTAQIADLRKQLGELNYKVQNPKGHQVPPVTATMNKAEIVAASQLFGLYTTQSPFDYGEFNGVQAGVNRNADVSGYFQSWDTDFRPDAVQEAWSRGQIPLLTWESQSQVGAISAEAPEYSLGSIINGQHDEYLRKYARDIAATGLPLVLRFNHEMNGTWYPWSEVRGWDGKSINGNKKGEYVKMWRHVHDIFTEEGANEYVAWLWAPNRVNKIPSQPDPVNFYPGDEYVDWIGMSGYYRPGDPQPTFDNTYGQTLPLLRAATSTKPIFLAEIGATEEGGNKVTWITSLFEALAKPENADINGFGWFSLAVTSGGEGEGRTTNDWRLDSSAPSLRAAAAGLAATGFGQPRE